MSTEFDYIIVGAGSSGAVVANRLSADPSVTVCLIEAGPKDTHPLISIPLGIIALAKNPKLNWLLPSVKHKGLNGRQITVPRGKTLGGSSAINGMIYVRGQRQDYDDWAANGCTGWAYDDILPYFLKSEKNTNDALDSFFHGYTGEQWVSDLKQPNELDYVFIDAACELQYRACDDFNTETPEGVGVYQVTQKHGKRHSTSAAFLTPIQKRQNLMIITDAVVERVVFNGKKACGVSIKKNDSSEQISARCEIVLSAGAIGSPDILMRSGISPAATAKALGVKLIHANENVGKNLQEHVDIMLINSAQSTTSYGISWSAVPRLAIDGVKWVLANSGMLSSNMVEAGGFIKSSPEVERPDLQFCLIPGKKSSRGRMVEWGHGVSLHTCVLRPYSRGSVSRTSLKGPPDIDLGLLSDERDTKLLTKGAKIARNILAQEPFKPHGLEEIHPGQAVQTDQELEQFVRNNAKTIYHPVGTCAMGVNGASVVDARLRVLGVEALRVVDASIMPNIVSGNTNAPCIMIGEKAADMMIEDRRHQ